MKNLIIIGARGFGREVYFLAQSAKGYGEEFILKGFLDDKKEALDGYKMYSPIISSVEDYVPIEDDVFICALGDPVYKRKYVEIILNKGGIFITLIHKNAIILPTAQIGKGCIIFQNVSVSADVVVGDYVTLQPMVFLGHDVKISDWAHLNTNCVCNGFVEVGGMAQIHTGAVIAPKKKVGENSVVGAGSFVTRNVKDNTTVFGNPAKRLI